MSYHEKMWWYELYLITAIIGAVVILMIARVPLNIVIAISGFIGFSVLPWVMWKKELDKERDEMIKEIERRAILLSLKIAYLLLYGLLFWFYVQTPSPEAVVKIPFLTLHFAIWGVFVLIVLVNSLAGLYYLKKGIES